MNDNLLTSIKLYFQDNMILFGRAVIEHIWISLLALLVATAVGIPCGYLCLKGARRDKLITSIFQILRIIPSLAILFLLIPLMGTGFKPALTALVILGIPPILMNTVTGLREVPEFMLETAIALGMTARQSFWKIRIPLALPMIMAGIKTALIEIIASATLAAKIGAGGLGQLIFTGLGLNRLELLLIGGLAVAIFSLLAGGVMDVIDQRVFPYKQH